MAAPLDTAGYAAGDSRAAAAGWAARLQLRFAPGGARTVLAGRRHYGPLTVQKPFYPEGAPCHVYLLHPPGGVVGGDRLELDVEVNSDAHALITTPASGKFYRSAGTEALQQQHLRVDSGATLEWLPQDTILFDGCNVAMDTRVELQADARFVGWEMVCLGRPAADEGFDRGRCRQRLELWRDGVPLTLERTRFDGGSAALAAPWGLAGNGVSGTLLATPADCETLAAVRTALDHGVHGRFAASLIDDVLVCRFLGRQGEAARRTFARAWRALRPSVVGREACPPRIWNT